MLRRVLQSTSQGHDALQLGLVLFRVQSCPLFCLLPCCLCRGPRLEFPRDSLQVIRHLGIRFEKEQLEVSRLVLQLHLRSVFKYIGYSTALAKQC